jgi:hypothetical protein
VKALRAWVLLRLPLPILLVALAPSAVGGVVGEWLTRLDYAHGTVKYLLVEWQSMLVREDRLLALFAVAAVGAAVLVGLTQRAWAAGIVVLCITTLAILRPLTWWAVPLAFAALALNTLPVATLQRLGTRWRAFAWIPGTEIFFPGPVAAAIGAGPRTLRLAAALGAVTLTGLWVWLDTSASFWDYERIVFAPWPDDRVDSRVTTIARAPEGVKCDFHDIDVVGDRAVVVAESSLRLLSFPRAGGEPASWPLTPWWGPMEGLAMDSETDPTGSETWFLSGPHDVTSVTWNGAAWGNARRSAQFQAYIHHAYLHYLPEQQELVLFTIGTHNAQEDTLMVEVDTPGMRNPRVRHLRLPGGGRPPTIRDIAWVPPLGKFVLSPDFGDRLYLVAPGEDTLTPWIETPTLNGRVKWVGGLDRLFVPLPNRPELWIVDPVRGTVERRMSTQPGVRTLDVDVARGLVLTASVLTGRVMVQRLEDGAVVDRFGTLMPMVRNLALFPEKGVALLSTWTALYRIPYVSE